MPTLDRIEIYPVAVKAAALPAADLDRLRGIAGNTGGQRSGGHAVRDSFHLVPGQGGPCEWLSEVFGFNVLLQERADGGFPDDRDASGPTLVSTATLTEVGRWFGFDLAESRQRFRVNLEIGDCDPFWEDTLASPARPELQPSLLDLPPVVPTRDSCTGIVTEHFRDAFEARRSRRMRADVDPGAWGTLYRLAVNTKLHGRPVAIAVGSGVMPASP